MINLKGSVCNRLLVSNLIEHSKKTSAILSSNIFKLVLTGSVISILSTPVFAEVIKVGAEKNEILTSMVSHKSSDVTSKIFEGLKSSGKVKAISFSEKNSYKNEMVRINAFSPDPSAIAVTNSIYEGYVESVNRMEGDQLISSYKSWLNHVKAKNELINEVKDGLSNQAIENIENSIKEIEMTDFRSDKDAINDLRSLVIESGLNSLPNAQKIKSLNKSELAYAIQSMGVCSIIYNEDIFQKVTSTGVTRSDGSKAYSSRDEVLKAFILNHEITHCTSSNSPFLIKSNSLAAKELSEIKTSSNYDSLTVNDKAVFNIFAMNYSTYIPEFYADLIGISKTIEEKKLSEGESVTLINDIIDIRNAASLKGDISHATGSLLERSKEFYNKKGMTFGSDLLGHEADQRISDMMSTFSKKPMLDAMKNFLIIASSNHKNDIDVKSISINNKKLYMNIEYKNMLNAIPVSNRDIGRFVNSSRGVFNRFSLDEDKSKISTVVNRLEKSIKSELSIEKSFLSMDY